MQRSIEPTHVDIWYIPIPQHIPLSTSYAYLDSQEKARCDRLHHTRHQQQFAYTRMAVKKIISTYLENAPPLLSFDYDAQGKPHIPHTSLQVNWSHSQESALLAVGHTHPVGIDIEHIHCRSFQGIAKLAFSDSEQHDLTLLSPSLLPFGFFAIWSNKEAFIKAIGEGLSYPLTKFSIPSLREITLDQPYPLFDPVSQQAWQGITFLPQPGVMAAACTTPDIRTFQHHVYPCPS